MEEEVAKPNAWTSKNDRNKCYELKEKEKQSAERRETLVEAQ